MRSWWCCRLDAIRMRLLWGAEAIWLSSTRRNHRLACHPNPETDQATTTNVRVYRPFWLAGWSRRGQPPQQNIERICSRKTPRQYPFGRKSYLEGHWIRQSIVTYHIHYTWKNIFTSLPLQVTIHPDCISWCMIQYLMLDSNWLGNKLISDVSFTPVLDTLKQINAKQLRSLASRPTLQIIFSPTFFLLHPTTSSSTTSTNSTSQHSYFIKNPTTLSTMARTKQTARKSSFVLYICSTCR